MLALLEVPVRVTSVVLAVMTLMAPTTGESSPARLGYSGLFGAYAPPAPHSGMEAVVDLERTLGRQLDVVLFYQAWGGGHASFNEDWIAAAAENGRKVLLTWEPWVPGGPVEQPEFRLKRIINGRYDTYIRSWARGLRRYGKRVYLRPMHEMNGTWYPWGGTVNGNRPWHYRAAWRHIHDIFEAAGATNVRWVWSPNADDVPADNDFERYYPGASYVDVLALDGYNWGDSEPGYGGWRTFSQVFGVPYGRIRKLGSQPIWIAETASATEGGDKAAWVRDMFQTLQSSLQGIRAVVWFHTLKERDWRITSSPETTLAFVESLN